MKPRTLVITIISLFTLALMAIVLFFYLWPIISIKLDSKTSDAKWDLLLETEKDDLEKIERLDGVGDNFQTLEEFDSENEKFENIEIIKKDEEDIITTKKFSDTQKGFSLNYPSNYKVTKPTQDLVNIRSDFDCNDVASGYCIFQEVKIKTLNNSKDYTAEQWLEENQLLYELEEYVEISDRNSILAYPVGTAKEDPRYIIKNQDKLYLLDFSASVPPETRDQVLTSFNFIFFDKDGVRRENLQEKIVSLSKAVVSNVRNRNLYRYAHPKKGLRFSPYANINVESDRVFSVEEMVNEFDSDTILSWGTYDGSGDPIKLTFKDYYTNFIYDKDYSLPTTIGYNKKIGEGNSVFNFLDVYESSVFVEYYKAPDFGENEFNWGSLILIFEEYNEEWYLVGIVHDEWTI